MNKTLAESRSASLIVLIGTGSDNCQAVIVAHSVLFGKVCVGQKQLLLRYTDLILIYVSGAE